MVGVPKQAVKAVCALTFLVDEMEETSVNEVIRDAVLFQLNELTIDVKSLIEDTKEKIDEHVTKRSSELHNNVPTQPTQPQRSYVNALITPPPHADPKLAAREGIRARQFMLEGVREDSKVSHLNAMQLKSEFNRILSNLRLDRRAWSAILQKHKGILFEMDDDIAAKWMNQKKNQLAFCKEFNWPQSNPQALHVQPYHIQYGHHDGPQRPETPEGSMRSKPHRRQSHHHDAMGKTHQEALTWAKNCSPYHFVCRCSGCK